MSAATAGEIIYKAFMPTLRMGLTILAGYAITKTGALPPASTKGISLITMNICLPSLIFSSMTSAFTPQNVGAFGPLVMLAIIYQVLGGILAFVVRELFYVPADFQWGLLVMGIISNWGNLPTAVVQTMAKESPFDPSTDVDLGVAYIAIFIFVMNTTFFALGVHKICGWDFIEDHQLSAPLPFKERWRSRFAWMKRTLRLGPKMRESKERSSPDPEMQEMGNTAFQDEGVASDKASEIGTLNGPSRGLLGSVPATRKKSRAPSITAMMDSRDRIPPHTPLESAEPDPPVAQVASQALPSPASSIRLSRHRSVLNKLWSIFLNVPPATWAVIFGLIFSLVQPLKALLTNTPGWTSSRIPNAPDGNPPLAFILETTVFLGAITVPMALMLLGASFARLRMPSNWRELPIMAIISMCVIKMILVPVFAVFVVKALRDDTSLFPRSEKIRTFVVILLSGTPAAANQLVITQLYNPAGTAHTLASFLLLQYALMFVLSTGLAAIALYIAQ